MVFLLVCLAAIALCLAAFTPRSTVIEGDLLKVRSLLFTFRFAMDQALEIQEVSERDLGQWKTLRMCGIGWPLKSVGWFFNKRFGLFLRMVDDPRHMYLIRFPRRRLLVSLQTRGAFTVVK